MDVKIRERNAQKHNFRRKKKKKIRIGLDSKAINEDNIKENAEKITLNECWMKIYNINKKKTKLNRWKVKYEKNGSSRKEVERKLD